MEKKTQKLHEKLNKLDRYPFHMPGHKRNGVFGIPASGIDITEIEGFDNLHDARGVILDIENRLGSIYRSKKSFLSVNGSTLGILAAVFAVCNEGDKILIARNCHKSVYNACLLRKLKVAFVEPDFDALHGCYTSVGQSALDSALSNNPDARAAVITSPTYEGIVSSPDCPIPLIVDAAHAAHFGQRGFPSYPKGDIVISSLHKTLPALTQTAAVNVYNEEFIQPVKRFMSMLETSSPSYVLMNSASICCDYVLNTPEDFEKLSAGMKELRGIRLSHLSFMANDDPSRIVVSVNGTDINAAALADKLRNEYLIEPEMVSSDYVVLICTVGDEGEALSHLANSLESIDRTLSPGEIVRYPKPPAMTGVYSFCYPPRTEAVKTDEAAGRISAEFVYAYPPDIPIIIPGTVINAEDICTLEKLAANGVNTVSDSGLFPDCLLTKKL